MLQTAFTQRTLKGKLGTLRTLKALGHSNTWALRHVKGTWALRHSGTWVLEALDALYLAVFEFCNYISVFTCFLCSNSTGLF